MEDRKVTAIENIKLMFKHWAALAGGILFAVMGLSTPFLFLFALIGIGYFFYALQDIVKMKQKVADEFDTLLEHCTQVLRATLAEVVDWRKEYEVEDQKAQLVTDLLEMITPEQYSFSSFDNARAIVN